jgi:tetratricopeptide (TPR) repeat protein
MEVSVKGADGSIPGQVMVQLITANGQLYDQVLVKRGNARFLHVPKREFRVLVTAAGYQRAEKQIDLATGTNFATVTVELLPLSDAEDAASDRGIGALKPKAQKEMGKALEALRTKKPNNARSHLEAAQREAPNSAEVEYLFGVYATQVNDPVQAQAHWKNALAFNPNHLSALLEVGQGLLKEEKSAEAMPYLTRALKAEPSSWRAQALLAEADYMQGNREDAIRHIERAMELGHESAASLQPLLAGILAQGGDKERAIHTLQEYLKRHPSDAVAAKQLEKLKIPQVAPALDHTAMAGELTAVTAAATALPTSKWLPPDVDEKVPPVESGAVCSLEEVLQKAGDQLMALVHNFDRFTATESLVDERINKWGVASSPEKRKFDYVASIEQIRPGYLSVDEYRNSGGKPVIFPNGVITNGLPSLVLVFHPFYAGNYEMTCEGLARWNGGLAWQVHFRQRPGKPIANRGFRMGPRGLSHPVGLRGRAWILAENYQIVRLETDLVHPVPEIRLIAEHLAIEYGSVNFREGGVNLWLPQSVEVHFDWMGQRIHRRHSFDNYMLFTVDEKERIGSPNGAKAPTNPNRSDATNPLF